MTSIEDARRRRKKAGGGDRIPPSNLMAEESLLGAMLITAEAVAAAVELCSPEDFYKPSHGHIFEAAQTLYCQGRGVDVITVADELRRQGLLELSGGTGALVQLEAAAPGTAGAARWATIVAEHSVLRGLIRVASEITDEAYKTPSDVGAAVDRARLLVAEVLDHYGEVLQPRLPLIATTLLADVKTEKVEWLWTGRLPKGKLVVIEGHPEIGKSALTTDLAARVSTGSPLPDGEHLAGPANVVLMSAEDRLGDTIKPRVLAAGGDVERIRHFDGLYTDSLRDIDTYVRSPSFPVDIAALSALIREEAAALVVVDVLNAYLSTKVDSWRDQDVRGALAPLSRVADETGACIVVVRHLTKAGGSNPLTRGQGSIGIIGAARVGLLVALDPDDQDRRVLAVTKCNIAKHAPAMAYRIVTDEEHECARIRWEGATAHKAADLLASPIDAEERIERDAAGEWLLGYLADHGLEARSKEIKKAARAEDISEATLKRAKFKEKVGHYSTRTMPRTTYWYHPDLTPVGSSRLTDSYMHSLEPNEPTGGKADAGEDGDEW